MDSCRIELGAAMGRGPVAAVGFTDRNFAKRAGELMQAIAGDGQ